MRNGSRARSENHFFLRFIHGVYEVFWDRKSGSRAAALQKAYIKDNDGS